MSRSFGGRPNPSEEPKPSKGGYSAGRGRPQPRNYQQDQDRSYLQDEDSSNSSPAPRGVRFGGASKSEDDGQLAVDPVQVDIGKRLVASLIDVVTGYLMGLFVNCIPFINVYVHDQLVLVLYLIIKDALFNGRGVGKNLMGLQVVDIRTGYPASMVQSVKRNIVVFGPYLLLYASNLILKIVPNEAVNSVVTKIVIGVGTIYTLLVIPYEAYRVYSRVDGRRWGDQLAGTATIPADMDFSNPLSK